MRSRRTFMRTGLATGLGVLGFRGVHAQTHADVRIARGFGIGYLPLMIMEHDKLVEKHLRTGGVTEAAVKWFQYAGAAAMNDALLSGNLDVASGGIPPFITLWEKTRGTLDAMAISAIAAMPMYLNTRSLGVKSVRDFSEKDRIAVAAVRVSAQAIYLKMAAAAAFGLERSNALDRLTVAMPAPEAMAALLSDHTEITAHFTVAPYMFEELKAPNVHTVLKSYDLFGGPGTELIVWSFRRFREERPGAYHAFVAALREAMRIVNGDKAAAAKLYVAATGNRQTITSVLRILDDPDFQYTMTPQNIMPRVAFMKKSALLKAGPATWKDLFFPEVHDLTGS